MNSIDLHVNYLADSLDDSNKLNAKTVVSEIFDLYKKDIISEKSFKYFIDIIFASFIENKFEAKYVNKIWNLDEKLTMSLLKSGKYYARK
jgi:hypothetical protein